MPSAPDHTKYFVRDYARYTYSFSTALSILHFRNLVLFEQLFPDKRAVVSFISTDVIEVDSQDRVSTTDVRVIR